MVLMLQNYHKEPIYEVFSVDFDRIASGVGRLLGEYECSREVVTGLLLLQQANRTDLIKEILIYPDLNKRILLLPSAAQLESYLKIREEASLERD